ncbi:MAG TPA: 2-keto-4-pentenoate hydratase [Acidimicrobiales bacterium]|nr:2-keto-4-pentenoate hydratase [Acidimicrobiales bacterium]
MNPTDLAAAAESLFDAQEKRVPVEPLTDVYEDLDVTAAYEIQLANIRRRVDAGDTIQGHKVGLSAKAMQQMLGVNEPDYGHLLESMFIFECDTIDVSRFIQPRVEIEVAFVLGRSLAGPGVTVADVIQATDFVLPSLEIVDSRVADWRIKLPDTIADNASSGAVVLGGSPTRLTDVDVRLIGATLRSNGELRETGASGAVLGNPVVAVAWLANKVASFGVTLEAGHVIMPGSCTRMIPVSAGDTVRAEFDRLGHVAVAFA